MPGEEAAAQAGLCEKGRGVPGRAVTAPGEAGTQLDWVCNPKAAARASLNLCASASTSGTRTRQLCRPRRARCSGRGRSVLGCVPCGREGSAGVCLPNLAFGHAVQRPLGWESACRRAGRQEGELVWGDEMDGELSSPHFKVSSTTGTFKMKMAMRV